MSDYNILIVEDERLVALSIKEILLSEGYAVCGIARSTKNAMEVLAECSPDLALMDIKIKGNPDGIDLAIKLKKDFGIPSVFLTAYSDNSLLERAKSAEPLGYILKPFKQSDILSAVKMAVHRSVEDRKREQKSREMEEEVAARTEMLDKEMATREIAEKELQQKSDYLHDANKALKNLLEARDAEKRALEESILVNIKKYVMPYVEMIRSQTSDAAVLETVDFLEDALQKAVSPAAKSLFAKYLDLTPQESRIADLIRQGKKTKDIADILNLAPSSISTHRYSIRRKLGLLNSSTNLETFLNADNGEA
ncbi:MAG: response regulator [Halodesulfovibrio sp.]